MFALEDEARIALAAKQDAERDLARLALCPPWRHAAFAATEAALIFSPAVPSAWRFAILAIVAVAIALIVRSDRRRVGVFINGYRRGKTRLVTLPMLVAILLLYGASAYSSIVRHQPLFSVMLAIIGFAVGYAGSLLWQRVFVRELGA